jgi:ADP-ribosylation factor GTPase-activating protein 1
LEDPIASLSKGFGWLSANASTAFSVLGTKVQEGAKLAAIGAEKVGTTLNENVIKPTATAIQDPKARESLTTNVGTYVSTFGQKVAQVGNDGFQLASKWINETVEGGPSPKFNGDLPTGLEPGQDPALTGYANPWDAQNQAKQQQASPTSPGWDDWDETSSQPPKQPQVPSYGSNANNITQPPKSAQSDGWDDF